jgi:hypothetical protein
MAFDNTFRGTEASLKERWRIITVLRGLEGIGILWGENALLVCTILK